MIRVIEDGAIDSEKTDKHEFLADIPYMQDIQRPSDVFDSAKYWFDTEYAKSFFTKEDYRSFCKYPEKEMLKGKRLSPVHKNKPPVS